MDLGVWYLLTEEAFAKALIDQGSHKPRFSTDSPIELSHHLLHQKPKHTFGGHISESYGL